VTDDVQVKFGAQIDSLVSGVDAAKESIASVTEPISGVMEAFQSLSETIVAGLALEQITEAIDKFAEMGEAIARTARITGESTDNVQLFTTAIKLSGGDAETAAMTLNILQKNIGDAISKAGPARAAFEGMGFSLQQLKNTDIVTLLFEMKQRMEEAGTSAEQSALKMEYMRAVAGRSGAQFLALKDSLDDVKKVVGETGSSMSPGMVKDADELSDHLHTLDLAWSGLKNTLADVVSPAYDAIISKTKSLIESTSALLSILTVPASASSPGIGMFAALGKLNTNPQRGAASGSWGSGPSGVNLAEGQFGPSQAKPLAPLDNGADGGGDDADKTQEQIDRNDYQTALELQKLKLQNKKDTDEAAVQSGHMSAAQQIADLQQMAAQEYAIELQAVDQLAGTYDEDSTEYAALQNKKVLLAQQYTNEVAKLNEQLAAAQKKQYEAELAPWKSLMEDMGGAANTMINGVLSGTQTWKQALTKSYDDLGIKFAEVMVKMTGEYLAFEATSGKGFLGFGTSNPFAALSGGAATGATGAAGNTATSALTTAITGNTAVTTQNTSGILQQLSSMLESVAQTLGLTTATTAQATATTANATATSTAAATTTGGLIPTIAANITALTANTTALIASKALPSYDVGSWSIPTDQVAMVHAGEMIIPAQQAGQIRSGAASIGGSSGGVSGGGGNFTINVNAIDTQSGANFLKQNANVIAQTLSGSMRNFNSNLRN
jgi:hypothetical protein